MQTIEIAPFKLPKMVPDEFPLHQGLLPKQRISITSETSWILLGMSICIIAVIGYQGGLLLT